MKVFSKILLFTLLQICWAAQDEFFKDSEEFLENQFDKYQEAPIIGQRIGFGPRVMVVQSQPEMSFGLYYLYDVNEQFSLGLQGFSWVEDTNQWALGSKFVFGQAYQQIGAFGMGFWWFNENLESIQLNSRQENGRQTQDWAISGSYLKEIIPWSGFHYFPRFELELGYRHQEFLRRTDVGGIKTSHLWLSAQLSVSIFLPRDELSKD